MLTSAAIAAASLLQNLGQPEKARAVLERIADPGARSAALGWMYYNSGGYHSGRYEEAAAALACPIGSVRSRLHRGRARLAELLRDAHPAGRPAAQRAAR